MLLLGTADSSPQPPPCRARSSSQVFVNETEAWGAWPRPLCPWPRPLCPWPSLPHSCLQVLKDDGAIVAEHIRDAAGAEPRLAWRHSQQSQQDCPERRLRRHLEGTRRQGGVPRPVQGASPLATLQAICFGQSPKTTIQGVSELVYNGAVTVPFRTRHGSSRTDRQWACKPDSSALMQRSVGWMIWARGGGLGRQAH